VREEVVVLLAGESLADSGAVAAGRPFNVE
jgi:hypothetical protein